MSERMIGPPAARAITTATAVAEGDLDQDIDWTAKVARNSEMFSRYAYDMRSREFLQFNGQPEDAETLTEHEASVDQEIKETNRDPEFEKLLAKIDLDWLRQRFGQVLSHTDVDPATLNFIPADRITSDRSLESSGMYSTRDNQILVNPEKIKEQQERWQVPAELVLLEIFTHEQIHAVSKTQNVGLFEDNPEYSLRTGYSLFRGNSKNESKEMDTYTMFDEGVTEKWSRQIYQEYLQAHPDLADPESVKRFQNMISTDGWAKVYDLEISLVEAMMAKLAKETGVSTETVWQAILRSKLEGEDLDHPDFQELAKQFFSDKVLQGIKSADSGYHSMEAIPLIKDIDLDSIDPDLKARIDARILAAQAWKAEEQSAQKLAA